MLSDNLDVALIILSYLDDKSLCSVFSVSRKYRQLFDNENLWVKKLETIHDGLSEFANATEYPNHKYRAFYIDMIK